MLEAIHTEGAPSFESFDLPISQAIVHGDTVYVAGQTGIDPATGELVEGGIEAETRQTLENIEAILEAAGTSFDNVLKATVFIEDMTDFDRVNAVYRAFVSEPYPARSAVEVSDLALEFAMEIEVIAALEP